MTVLEVVQSTTAYFKKRKLENPRRNAEHLVAHSLGKKRIELYLEFERALTESELAPLRELVRRRAQNEPLQHVLGTVEFCGQTFLCDQRALIPRPETEQLVELIIQSTINPPQADQPSTILDVGTGSGIIVLSLGAHFPSAELHATDVSDEALALARENAERLGLCGRVHFSKGHLLESVEGRFDLIVANLPYVASGDAAHLAPEVQHDPAIALFSGTAGDELIRQLINTAPPHLQPGGMLALEIGIGQQSGLCDFLAAKNYHDIAAKKDYAGIARFLFARYG